MATLFQVPASYWRPQISDISSVAQRYLANVCIPPSNKHVGIDDEQTLQRCVFMAHTERQQLKEPNEAVDVKSVVGLVVPVYASERASSLENSWEPDDLAISGTQLDTDSTLRAHFL